MNATPNPTKNSFENDSWSAILNKPIAIVVTSIVGPTMASKAFIANAFLTSLKTSIRIAAVNSIVADKILSPAIDNTLVSIKDNHRFIVSSIKIFSHLYKPMLVHNNSEEKIITNKKTHPFEE